MNTTHENHGRKQCDGMKETGEAENTKLSSCETNQKTEDNWEKT